MKANIEPLGKVASPFDELLKRVDRKRPQRELKVLSLPPVSMQAMREAATTASMSEPALKAAARFTRRKPGQRCM